MITKIKILHYVWVQNIGTYCTGTGTGIGTGTGTAWYWYRLPKNTLLVNLSLNNEGNFKKKGNNLNNYKNRYPVPLHGSAATPKSTGSVTLVPTVQQ
jgi:hypothetical protein